MPRLILLFAILCLLALGSPAGHAQPVPAAASSAPAAAPLPDVAELRRQLDRVPETADSAEARMPLLAQLATLAQQAQKLVDARSADLNDLNARLGELGSGPPPGGSEDAGVTRLRNSLLKDHKSVDGDIRLARLVIVDAQQRAAALRGEQRDQLETRISERGASPLGRRFWLDLAAALPQDLQRLGALGDELAEAGERAAAPGQSGPLLATAALALALLVLGGLAGERGLPRLLQRSMPPGRLRRSLLVIALVLLKTMLMVLAVQLLLQALDAAQVPGPLLSRLLHGAAGPLAFMAFVIALGRALLANARPAWRLPPLSDALARRLAPYPWLTGLLALLLWLPREVNRLVQASAAAVAATDVFVTLALTALSFALLLRLREDDGEGDDEDENAAASSRPAWVAVALGALALLLFGLLLLVALGFVGLASLLAGQLVWTALVGAAFYVLFRFADDACMALLSARGVVGRRLHAGLGFPRSTLDQAAVLLSALLRVVLFLYMLLALGEPLGSGPEDVLDRSGRLGSGLTIGEFQLVPAALLTACAVLLGGFVALRVFGRWLRESYLPTTSLEDGAQSSLATLLNYAGAILVVSMALSALGIGVNRIAWIASALSVGIGFGLQAVVQNFISGLILLAERPVKVGDWVVLGTTEGDIRRINVRATEVQLADRSTMIVPNSEFITKTVRNMTLANAEGRVLIRLPMPLACDAQRVRDLMLATCAAHEHVLQQPAPLLLLDGVENGMLMFQAVAYVDSPRRISTVRSELLFAMLESFREAGVAMAAPAMVIVAPPVAPAA